MVSHVATLKTDLVWYLEAVTLTRCMCLPLDHFFFPGKEKKDDRKDPLEQESFKDNPVLRALAQDKLPNERPNYEYFAQLLASDSLVTIRPSSCWILISSATVSVETEGPRRGEGYKSDGQRLDPDKYPHLPLNLARDENRQFASFIHFLPLAERYRTLSSTEAREGTLLEGMPPEARDFVQRTRPYAPPLLQADGSIRDLYAERTSMLKGLND